MNPRPANKTLNSWAISHQSGHHTRAYHAASGKAIKSSFFVRFCCFTHAKISASDVLFCRFVLRVMLQDRLKLFKLFIWCRFKSLRLIIFNLSLHVTVNIASKDLKLSGNKTLTYRSYWDPFWKRFKTLVSRNRLKTIQCL